MKINRKFGYYTCGRCGENFQVLSNVMVEKMTEDGETIFVEEKDVDTEASYLLSDEHDRIGCTPKKWSWDDVEYYEEEE